MDPRTKLLEELATRYVAPILTGAGFRKLGKRRWLAGQAPGNLQLVDMRPHHSDFEQVGFWIEWATIPAAMCDFWSRGSARPGRPHVTWGIVADRVDVPFEMVVPFNINVESTYWVFSVSDGLDECGAALQRLLTEGGVLDQWSKMLDREHVLRVLDEGTVKFRLPPGTPSSWPWRYLVMYIDDGDPELLDSMLAPLEEAFPAPDPAVYWRLRNYEVAAWLRQRLNNRVAEHRA